MSNATYVIRNAGQYESALAADRTPIRTTEYRNVRDAAADVAKVARLDVDTMHVAGPCGEADWYVYASEEDADRDDGSRAVAIIVTKNSYEREARSVLFDDVDPR